MQLHVDWTAFSNWKTSQSTKDEDNKTRPMEIIRVLGTFSFLFSTREFRAELFQKYESSDIKYNIEKNHKENVNIWIKNNWKLVWNGYLIREYAWTARWPRTGVSVYYYKSNYHASTTSWIFKFPLPTLIQTYSDLMSTFLLIFIDQWKPSQSSFQARSFCPEVRQKQVYLKITPWKIPLSENIPVVYYSAVLDLIPFPV